MSITETGKPASAKSVLKADHTIGVVCGMALNRESGETAEAVWAIPRKDTQSAAELSHLGPCTSIPTRKVENQEIKALVLQVLSVWVSGGVT